MDFVHFLKSQRYRSRVPLRQLQFTVAVYRAIVVEEANVELLAETTVPWDGKVFSPLETLNLYKDLTLMSLQSSAATDGPLQHASAAGGGAAAANAPSLVSGTAALGLTDDPSPPPHGDAQPSAAVAAATPNRLALPHPADVIAQLQRPQSNFFTRPTQEDFIDKAEEDFPVDPPQGPSLLAPIILRQHRRDHQPNRKMFLMWAAGDIVVPPGTQQAAVSMSATQNAIPTPSTAAAKPAEASGNVTDTFAPPSTAAAAAAAVSTDVAAITWRGVERVLCTLTAEPDEHVFTARPSLDEVHTLFVDSAYIYTFRVTVSKTERSAAAGRWAGAIMENSAGLATPSAAPLDVVLASVRELAQYTEEQFEALEVGHDGTARRLLRQAAMMVPEERGSTGPAVVAATAATDDAQRFRRTSLGASISFANGADRAASVAFGTTTTTAFGGAPSAASRATGVSGALLSRSTAMRSGPSLPRGMCQFYIFGTVDRCVGVPESTLFLRCQLVEDSAATAWLYDPLTTSSPSAVCEFTSQLAHVSTFVDNECIFDIDHVFNLPFDHTMVGAAVPSSPLRLLVTAFTEGEAAEGVQSAVAYACVTLPIASPGRHALRAAMWAPHKTGVEFLRSTLLGGAPSLVDARQAGPPPSHRTGISVKEGLYADSVGSVHLTVNILHHKNQKST